MHTHARDTLHTHAHTRTHARKSVFSVVNTTKWWTNPCRRRDRDNFRLLLPYAECRENKTVYINCRAQTQAGGPFDATIDFARASVRRSSIALRTVSVYKQDRGTFLCAHVISMKLPMSDW